MAELESVKIDIIVNELAQEIQQARARKRQVLRTLDRIAGMMKALGLDSVCLGNAIVRKGKDEDGNDELYYTASSEEIQEIHDRLAAARYYSELLADLDELQPYLSEQAKAKAELVKQHLDELIESLKCREG